MATISASYALPPPASPSAPTSAPRAPASIVDLRAAGEHVLADAPQIIAEAGRPDGTGVVVNRTV